MKPIWTYSPTKPEVAECTVVYNNGKFVAQVVVFNGRCVGRFDDANSAIKWCLDTLPEYVVYMRERLNTILEKILV